MWHRDIVRATVDRDLDKVVVRRSLDPEITKIADTLLQGFDETWKALQTQFSELSPPKKPLIEKLALPIWLLLLIFGFVYSFANDLRGLEMMTVVAFVVTIWLSIGLSTERASPSEERDRLSREALAKHLNLELTDFEGPFPAGALVPRSDLLDPFLRYFLLWRYTGVISGMALDLSLAIATKRTASTEFDAQEVLGTVWIVTLPHRKHSEGLVRIMPDLKLLLNQAREMAIGLPPQVELENAVFEKKFEVYAADPVEARYILSPMFMERLVAFSEKDFGPISIGAQGDDIALTIVVDDLWEWSPPHSAPYYHHVLREAGYIARVLFILRELGLDLQTRS